MDALEFLNDRKASTKQSSAVDFLNSPTPKSKPLWQKALDFASMGHLYGDYGPENELTAEGKLDPRVQSGDPGFFQDPVTALAMGGVAGVRAAAGPVGKLVAAGRESLGWITGGASEIPSLAKAGVKGAVKVAEVKNLAKIRAARAGEKFAEVPIKMTAEQFLAEPAAKVVAESTPKIITTEKPTVSMQERLSKRGEVTPTLPPEIPEISTENVIQPPIRVQRYEEPGIERANFDKPHGIYTTPSEFESPHADLGGTKYEWEVNPDANILDIEPYGRDIALRNMANSAGAGVHATRKLLGEETFQTLKSGNKKDAIAYAKESYPEANVDWSKYYDKQEVIEAIGGLEARKYGYDAMRMMDKEMPEFSEVVLLNEKAAKPIEPPKPFDTGIDTRNIVLNEIHEGLKSGRNFGVEQENIGEGWVNRYIGSSNEPWLNDFMKDFKKATGTAVKKDEIQATVSKMLDNKPLTEKQTSISNHLEPIIRDYERSGHFSNLASEIDIANKGYTPQKGTIEGYNIDKGDKFVIDGEEFTAKAIDEEGNVILKDGVTHKISPDDTVKYDAIKKGEVQPEKFSEESGTLQGFGEAENFNLANPDIPSGMGEWQPNKPKLKNAVIPGTERISPETLEVMVKGGRVGNLSKYAEGSSINLERMDTTQDVKQFLDILTQSAEKEIGKQRVSWDETTKAAEELAWDSKEFLKQAKKKGGFDASEIHAMRQIHTNTLHDLFKSIKEMPADPAMRTDMLRLELVDKVNNYVEIMKETSRHSSEAGRALNIHKKMIRDNPDFALDARRQKVFKEMFDSLGGKEMTDQMLSDLKNVDFNDPKAVRDILHKYHQSRLSDKIYEAWMNSILSAPATHAANLLGNTITMFTKLPETAASEFISGRNPLGALKAESLGMYQGLKEGMRSGIKAFETGVPSDVLTKVEFQRFDAIPGKLGKAIRTPTRALTAGDEFFKAIVYRSELNKQAYILAKKEGLSGNALAERMNKAMNDVTDPLFRKIHDKASKESLYRTFNNPLGKLGNRVMSLRNDVPGMRYILPFIRTPMNIAKFSIERLPTGIAKKLIDYKRGKISPEELSSEMAKPIVGSFLAASTVIGVLEGKVTGAPPKNKKERELLESVGWQPYSVKIGDKYVSYNRLEPVGSIIGMTADFVNATNDDAATINDKAAKIALSFSRNIVSKTFTQGISAFLDAISDPERYGGNYIEKFAGSLVPSVVAAAGRSVDPVIREINSPLDAMKARMPFASKSLPPKIGAFNEALTRPGNALSRLVSPVVITTEDSQKLERTKATLSDLGRKRVQRKLRNQKLKELKQDRYRQ